MSFIFSCPDTGGFFMLLNAQPALSPTHPRLGRAVQLSDGIRARIVGNVNEDGLWWWRNGVRQSRNAPHPNRSKYYVFHGTWNPMWNGDLITYQDYISFRHNIGSGGRGSVLFAGQYRVG